MDTLSPFERSQQMSRVRGKDTRCELVVRRLAHRLGYRFRLHRRELPGSPDLVFVSRRRVVFVHGCFWHRHPRCRNTRMPKSRLAYWQPKLAANVVRDRRNRRQLKSLGWQALVVWECELRDETKVAGRLREFLDSDVRQTRGLGESRSRLREIPKSDIER